MLRTAALWTIAYGVLAGVAAGFLRGPAGASSAAIGALVVVAMFASGLWALRLVLRGSPHLAQAGAFGVFFLQMYVGLMLVTVGRQASWIDASSLAAGAIGATLVWQAGMVTGFATARRQVYSTDDDGHRERAIRAARATQRTGERPHMAESDDRHYDRLGPIGGGDDVYTNVLSRLLAGPLVFGLIGFLLDRRLDTSFFLPIGLIGGMALAIYVIWLRYGTAVAPAQRAGRTNPPHEETQ